MSVARAPPPTASHPPAQALRPAQVAWVALVPCALATFAAIMLLGPPLGHALPGPGSDALWPAHVPSIPGHPEPVKHARYLLALLGPALLAAVVLARGRRPLRLAPARRRALIVASQAAVLAFLVAAALGQRGVLFPERPPLQPLLAVRTLVVAVALGLLAPVVLRWRGLGDRVARLARETPPRRACCLAAAVLVTAVWMLPALDNEHSIGTNALGELLTWSFDDPFAVLNGRTPLVDYHPLYAQLWPYASAVVLRVLGTSITAYTASLTATSGLVLCAVYAVLRRVTRSSAVALALYLPLLATGFLTVFNLSNVNIFSVWPIRYGGAYLLAWLTARHLDGAAPRRAWPLFLAAGLVALDNLEFGLAALAATFVALALALRSWQALGRLAAEAAGAVLGAVLLVSLLTLAHGGALPRFGLLLEYPRIFGVLGLVAMDMPVLGFQLLLFATFVAAIVVAVVRVVSGEREPLLTGLLAWSGVFGLLAGGYYVGRSDALKLLALFSIWAFALVLLTFVVVGRLAARGWRRPSVAELCVLAGFALAALSLAHVPAPWTSVQRLGVGTQRPLFKQLDALRFVRAHTHRGERVAILIRLGHRVAEDLGLTNIAPYSFIGEMFTTHQWRTMLDAVHRERVHSLFVAKAYVYPAHLRALAQAGFTKRATDGRFSLWSDAP